VTEEAGQALVSGDPMWCPGNALPGSTGCTVKHPSFSALVTDLETNPALFGAGTIYISYDYNATIAGDAGSNIVFDYSLVNLYGSLTLQGGWNFSSNKVVGTSTIANTNLSFLDWGNTDGGTLTFNNLVFDGGYLRIEDSDEDSGTTLTQADVSLNNVTVTNFTANEDNADYEVMSAGIGIRTAGDIALNNVNASNNVSSLEDLSTAVYAVSTDGDVTANGGSFNNNGVAGLMVGTATGTATLNNLTATGNEVYGVFGMGGDLLTINGGQFNNNAGIGLGGGSHGDIILNDVTATGNGTIGAMLIAAGDVTVNRGNFSNNVETGVGVQNGGNVTLNNVIATGNTASGAGVLSMFGNVSVICGNYSGLAILAGGDIYLGGPVITGSGLNLFEGYGTVTYGECPKPVEDDKKDQPGDGGEQNTEALLCSGEKKVALKAGDAFGVYEKLCGFEFQLTEANALPSDLPSGATEIAGLLVQLTSGGALQDALPTGGMITLKFPVPEGTDATSLVALFWNGSEWVEVPGEVNDEFFIAIVNMPGNYVLVTQ
jgi:hypothetical protein